MPSFNHILILAVLALSVLVQSAPVGTEPAHSIALIERFPLPGTQVTEVSEEAVNVDLDERDFDDEDTDPSFLARRATKTSTTAPKAKVTKAPKSKTTKAVAPKPKTTKAKTTKVKTTAKATKGTKPAKTTKAATTAKPTKTPKITKTSKASSTAKATGTATPSACPAKKPAKKSSSLTARAFDYIAHLFARDDEEFIGWHGTNSKTANDWVSNKNVKKPEGGTGTAQGNAEIGLGLYLADDRGSSVVSATINAQRNPGTMPMVCAIYAKSSTTWRDSIHKAFIPEGNDIIGDTPEKEKTRVQHIKQALPNVPENTVVRFALLDRRPNKVNGQMVIPESIASNFYAKKCFKVEGMKVAASDEAAANVGTKTWPEFDYNGDTLRGEWKILPENANGCS